MKVTQVGLPSLLKYCEELTLVSIQLYTYPIKSVRAFPLTKTQITPHGFPYDRRFMLFKILPEGQEQRLQMVTVTFFSEMGLFQQKIEPWDEEKDAPTTVTVMFRPPEKAKSKDISLPLVPDYTNLELVDIELHQSPTKAYNMGEPYNAWFSSCFGWEVMLVYLGPHLRPVLGNLSPNAAKNKNSSSKSWYSSVTQALTSLPMLGAQDREGLTFTDCAPYLVVTEESLKDVSARLPVGMSADITKFRPNIVLAGAGSAYEEDFWGALTFSRKSHQNGKQQAFDLILTANCGRCVSLNIDYATGKPGKGEDGSLLKKLSKDRRVDAGNKYSPIFGRYAFLAGGGSVEPMVTVGDEVEVCKRNAERTKFGTLM